MGWAGPVEVSRVLHFGIFRPTVLLPGVRVLLYGTAAALTAVPHCFLGCPAVLKYIGKRRDAAGRCSFKETAVSSTDRAVTWGPPAQTERSHGDPERGDEAKRAAELLSRRFLVFFPLCQKPCVGLPSQELGMSPRGTLDTTEAAVCGTQESPKGEILTSVLPEWECWFPARAASNSLIDLRAGWVCTKVPGTVRVGSAVADTPQSMQVVSCGSRQGLKGDRGLEKCFFSWQGEESERSGITLPDTQRLVGKSDKWDWGHAVP